MKSHTAGTDSGITRRSLLRSSAAAVSAWQMAKFSAMSQAAESTGIADAFADAFHIGVAVADFTLDQNIQSHLDLIAAEFSSVTGENCMKWERIRPDGHTWSWDRADKLVDLGTANNMYVLGHTLVWHSQVPRNVFQAEDGSPLDRTALLGVMEEHIATLVGRYKGRIHGWDVVNEGLDEGNGWRRSPWFNTIGDDFMEQALRFAHEADPDASLLYNDYNMHNPQKREFLLGVLHDYLDRDVPIHGIGLQGHVGLDYPDLDEWEASIAAYADLGLEVHISELEVDVLPNPYNMSAEISNRFQYSPENDPYKDGFPEEAQQALAERYEEVFRILLKYRDNVKRVTMWGLHDGITWKNDFPIGGRTNYPLLFDRDMQRKRAYFQLLELAASDV